MELIRPALGTAPIFKPLPGRQARRSLPGRPWETREGSFLLQTHSEGLLTPHDGDGFARFFNGPFVHDRLGSGENRDGQVGGEDGKRLGQVFDVLGAFDRKFVLDPVGNRDLTERDTLLEHEPLLAHLAGLRLSDLVALFDFQMTAKVVERLAARRLIAKSIEFVEMFLLRFDQSAGFVEGLASRGPSATRAVAA